MGSFVRWAILASHLSYSFSIAVPSFNSLRRVKGPTWTACTIFLSTSHVCKLASNKYFEEYALPKPSSISKATAAQSSSPPFLKEPRLLPSTSPSRPTWCAYNTSTYIVIRAGNSLKASKVQTTLENGISLVRNQLTVYGDSNIHNGQFQYAEYLDLLLTIIGAHQKISWSVVKDAVGELSDWMMIIAAGPGVLQAKQLEL